CARLSTTAYYYAMDYW
nr:immunoglobulin heavy chain junction region [Mus musculus]NSM07510.1 immunoglobulin heavy chain junction region [Mus musculus]